MDIMAFDPLLMCSVILMQIGAKYLDLELTDFQKKLLKNNIVQGIILFGIIYLPVRDIFKTTVIVFLIYLIVHVLLNEKHKYNVFSKQWLHTEGIIQNYIDIKKKYYENVSKI